MAPPELEDGPVLSSPAPLACFIKCGPCLDPHVFPPCHRAHPKPALRLLGGPSLGPFSLASGSHGLACLLERPLGPPPRALRFSPPSRAVLSTGSPSPRGSPRCVALLGLARVTVTLGSTTAASRITRQPPASLGPSRASLSYPWSLNLPAVLAPASGASLPPCPPARPWGHFHQKAFLSPTRKGSDPPEVSVHILFGCSLCTCHAVP